MLAQFTSEKVPALKDKLFPFRKASFSKGREQFDPKSPNTTREHI